MSFVNPILVAVGGALIGLPILLHLIMQQKPRDYVFPALRFVQERVASNQRRLRVRHWLLLLLRCLGLFLIGLAFAMPSVASNLFGTWLTLGILGLLAALTLFVMVATLVVTRPVNKLLFAVNAAIFAALVASIGSVYSSYIGGSPIVNLGKDQSPVSVVVLMDTSPRMLYQTARELDDGTTQTLSRLEEAKQLADWLIRELPDDSDVAIMDSSFGEPFFSVDIAAAAKRLSALRVNNDALSLVDRTAAAVDFLESIREEDAKPQEIYVFTDLTVASWKSRRQRELRLALDETADLSVYLIDVGVQNPVNFQLGDLELSSETVSQGGTVNLLTRIHRIGPPGERPVSLYLDRSEPGKPTRQDGKTVFPEQRQLRSIATRLDENGVQSLAFAVSELPTGVHHGVIRIDGADPLEVDNERYFTIEVRPPRRVLLIRPTRKDETETAVAARNIEIVLAPDELRELGQAQFEVETIDQELLLDTRLSDYEAVFLLDPKPLEPLAWKELTRFAEAGGGLAIALGENAKSSFGIDASFLVEEARDLLGGELRDIWSPDLAYLSISDFNHPVFQKFKPFQTDDVWRDFVVYQHWGFAPTADSAVLSVLARFTTQEPALIQHDVGQGRVMILTTPLTEPGQIVGRKRWNDLTTGEWWPAAMMIDEMAQFLVSSRNNRLNYRVGESALLREESPEVNEFLLYPPRNEEPTEIGFEEGEIRYRFTETAGNYRLKPVGNPELRRGFSVNLARQDTDLTRLAPELLDQTLGEDRFKLARTREEIVREQGFVREGKKFFPLLITLFGVILLMEYVLSNRFYRKL